MFNLFRELRAFNAYIYYLLLLIVSVVGVVELLITLLMPLFTVIIIKIRCWFIVVLLSKAAATTDDLYWHEIFIDFNCDFYLKRQTVCSSVWRSIFSHIGTPNIKAWFVMLSSQQPRRNSDKNHTLLIVCLIVQKFAHHSTLPGVIIWQNRRKLSTINCLKSPWLVRILGII